MANLKTLCVKAVFFSLTLTLFGCGSSSNDDDSVLSLPDSQVGTNEVNTGGTDTNNNTTNETNASRIDVTTHTTSLLSLDYPSAWTVDTSSDSIEAGFLSDDINAQGIRKNCALLSSFLPGGSLLELTDAFIDQFASTPMPDVSFITVNGTSMSRISGTLDASRFEAAVQLAYEDSYVHALLCIGLTPEELSVFFDSMDVF